MRLSTRYALDVLFLISGAFLVVAAMTFSAPVAGWLAFGVSIGLAVLAGTSAIVTRNNGRKIGHGLIAAMGVWSVIAALLFTGGLLTWMVFGDAIALAVFALADLTVHEVTTENVVHRLEVTTAPAETDRRIAA